MRAVILKNPGNEGRYFVEERPMPLLAPGMLLIRVAYAGVNRADLLQKKNRYPAPRSGISGMEVSGQVISLSPEVTRFSVGDKVCALVSEGAFAEYVAVDAGHVLPLPESVSLEQGAALPEACFTVWISFMWQAELQPGESVLIHGGTSSIGSTGIQIAKLLGARVFTTCGSIDKCRLAKELGAELAISYQEEDFVAKVKEATQGNGVDVILDMVGGDYFGRNLEALAHGGRLAIIAFQKAAKTEANLGPILLKHLKIIGSTLRLRPASEKALLAKQIEEKLWPAVACGMLKPLMDRIYPMQEAEIALMRMDQGLNIGKILLKMDFLPHSI